jgi:predicted MarR family transcription regulator
MAKRSFKSKPVGSGGAPPAGSPLLVSSPHLVSEKSRELSELEFGLIIAGHAFSRWVVRCMAAAGIKDLTTLDVLLLHRGPAPKRRREPLEY